MTRIRLYEHPLAVVAPRELEVPSLAVWLMDHYGDTPAVQVQIFAGEPSTATEITGDIRAILAGTAPEYVILQSPGDPISWTLTTWLLIGAAVAVATVLLMPKPVMPGNINRTQSSPNNALGNRENKVRMLERVEDIFGTVKSIPSLMMPTYNKYISHKKVEYGYYCVGRGYYDITQIKDGETIIGSETKVKVVKNKVAPPFREALFQILYGQGTNRLGELVDLAAGEDIIQKSGAWYAYQGNKIGQGKANACRHLEENPALAEEIDAEIRRRLLTNVGAAPVEQDCLEEEPFDIAE